MASRTALEAGQIPERSDDLASDVSAHARATNDASGFSETALGGAATQACNALWKPADAVFNRRMRAGVSFEMPDGETVRFWTYEDSDAPAHEPSLLSPLIRICEQQQARITLETHREVLTSRMRRAARSIAMHRPEPVWFETHESYTYHWQPMSSGTWFYQSHVSTARHFEMGLYGVIVVEPDPDQDGRRRASRHGPAYDVERLWVFDDVDPNWHDVALDGAALTRGLPAPAFKPQYFLINGVPNTQALNHAGVAVEAKRGEKVLLRLMNAGFSLVKVQLHGLAAQIIAVDGNTLGGADRPWTRWIDVAPGQPVHLATASRYDLLIDLGSAHGGCVEPGDYLATFEFQDGRRMVHNAGASHPARAGRAATTIRVL